MWGVVVDVEVRRRRDGVTRCVEVGGGLGLSDRGVGVGFGVRADISTRRLRCAR